MFRDERLRLKQLNMRNQLQRRSDGFMLEWHGLR